MSTRDTFVNEADRVIIYDDLAENVIHDMLGYDMLDYEAGDTTKAFMAAFDVVTPTGHFMADPDEDFYQGIDVMAVIKRKADGRLFGFKYWTPISKHADVQIEANGDEHGLQFDPPDGFDWDNDYFPEPYVFQPIEPFTITGYKITDPATAG